MIKLSDYIAKRLKDHGVNLFFMVSGGGAMHLNDSLGHNIKYIANHHEQASAIAAEGYARTNQKLAVVNVTTGPGGLNCLNGVFGQWTDSAPVLYISGQVKRATMLDNCEIPIRQLGDQETDIIQAVKHLTKYAVCVKEPNEIKYHIDRAIHEATTGRKGPCWLDIPIDVQASLIDENELKQFIPPLKKPEFFNIKEIEEKLKQAKRPLIIAGHGIRLSKQIENFKTLINQLNVPVVSTFNGFDILEDSNPYYIGRIGTIGQRAGNFALQNADLILCLGTRNNIRQVSYNWENFAKNAFKIMVDIDNAELNKPLVKPDLAIKADLADFIPELLKICNSGFVLESHQSKLNNCHSELVSESHPQFQNDWLSFCQNLKEKYCFKNHPEQIQKEKIEPYHFTYLLTSKMQENDTLVMANGSACVCIFQNAIIKKNQRFILNSGNASMGFGLPAGIGASFETKGRTVVLEGDGSIMMNLQELQTVAFNKIPLKIFVINNNGYSSIRQTQKNFFEGRMTGSGEDSGVGVPDFTKVASAFKIKAIKLSDPNDSDRIIDEVLNSDEPILCEVMTETEYSFAPKLSSRKLEDGTMVSATLEDMYPFLDREEFEGNMIKNE